MTIDELKNWESLKACPFCKRKEYLRYGENKDKIFSYFVGCSACEFEITDLDQIHLIGKWNSAGIDR